MIRIILSTVFFFALCRCQSVDYTSFRSCKHRKISNVVPLKVLKAKSKIHCASMCLNEKLCGSSNFAKQNGTCELLEETPFYEECETIGEESTATLLRKSIPLCIHGGRWYLNVSHCVGCDFGYSGTYCERHIVDCAEGKELGYTGIQTIRIQPFLAEKSFEIICGFKWGATYIERRGSYYSNGPVETFNRSWTDYKQGFGNASTEFFIGLQNLHLLTLQGNRHLKVQLHGPDKLYFHYKGFIIDEETKNYSMHYSSANSDRAYPSGNGFGSGAPSASVNHSPFCTYDRDCGSCALASASGWWFNTACSDVNLHTSLSDNADLKWPFNTSDPTKVGEKNVDLILFRK